MPDGDRLSVVRDLYRAFETGERELIEPHLSADFTFSSPYDVGLDRAGFFERCWPNAGQFESYEFRRLSELGDEVVVTYEATKRDGRRFRNTELLTFDGMRICRVEVYFGWDLD